MFIRIAKQSVQHVSGTPCLLRDPDPAELSRGVKAKLTTINHTVTYCLSEPVRGPYNCQTDQSKAWMPKTDLRAAALQPDNFLLHLQPHS